MGDGSANGRNAAAVTPTTAGQCGSGEIDLDELVVVVSTGERYVTTGALAT
jgi:hypothetical protein